MFYDLNVALDPADPELPNTLSFLAELGYTTVALSHQINLTGAKAPPPLPSPPQPPAHAIPPRMTVLSRLTVTVGDPNASPGAARLLQNATGATGAGSGSGGGYALVAVRPTTEKALHAACTTLECDLISLDLSARLPFHFRFPTIAAALARGLAFEIFYGPGLGAPVISSSSSSSAAAAATATAPGTVIPAPTPTDARRNLIANAASLVRVTRGSGGRGLILSSGACGRAAPLAVRAPADVVNLAVTSWAVAPDRAKEALAEEPARVVALAAVRRASWRGVVSVVYGGEGRRREVQQPPPLPSKEGQVDGGKKKGKGKGGDKNNGKGQMAVSESETVTAGGPADAGDKGKAQDAGTKRKASTSVSAIGGTDGAGDGEVLSKREMKRRAKKARLESAGGARTDNAQNAGA